MKLTEFVQQGEPEIPLLQKVRLHNGIVTEYEDEKPIKKTPWNTFVKEHPEETDLKYATPDNNGKLSVNYTGLTPKQCNHHTTLTTQHEQLNKKPHKLIKQCVHCGTTTQITNMEET